MKISTKIILFFLLLTVNSFNAQTVKITYTDVLSLGAPEANLRTYKAVLFITDSLSLYVTQIDSLENGGKKIQKVFKNKQGELKGVRSSSTADGSYQIINRKTKTLYSNTRFNNSVIYQEVLPSINWKIRSKQKKIEGIKVQKATCTFRGRKYIAWFATEIPIPLGPWKLNGLPGLIIEAYDSNKELLFLFKKLELPYHKSVNFPSLKREWNTYSGLQKKKEKHIEMNLKYARALGQHFESEAPDNEIEDLRKSSFIELKE